MMVQTTTGSVPGVSIPVLNLQQLCDELQTGSGGEGLQQLENGCEETGFFGLSHHGIATDLLTDMRQVLQEWFAQPEREKRRAVVEQHNYRGFIPLGMFTVEVADFYACGVKSFHVRYSEQRYRYFYTVIP